MLEMPSLLLIISICEMPNIRKPSPFCLSRYYRHVHTHAHYITPFVLHQRGNSWCLCQRGQIEFEVVYVAPEVDSDDENVEYEDDSGHRYRLYLDELDESSTAPPSNSSASLQG